MGANDVANAMGTSVGSRALTIKQAILIAMVFEFCGAYLAGGEVTETIKNGIVDAEAISPDLMVLGMMSALLAAGSWLLIASMKGWPVSTTHSIVGAVIGFAAVGVSADAVHWFLGRSDRRQLGGDAVPLRLGSLRSVHERPGADHQH